MSCFLVPMTQAILTTAYRKTHKEDIQNDQASPLMHDLPALEKMLWGGTLMLVVDHAVNGELFKPILWKELLTVGLPMSLALTAAWAIWSLVKHHRKSAVKVQ